VYATNDDSKEKCNVGDLWEEKSGGKALFLMTVEDKGNPSLFDQIAAKIARSCSLQSATFIGDGLGENLPIAP
ncbi:MAG TPA: hypothetical protein VL154_12195, partial [Acetobacteraceae bacterium]|nr:hypothetical protein [Acetobacteraceae bacterium]